MRPITVTVGPLVAASANNIALTQTPTAGALTLNGSLVVAGVAILDTARRVLITTTGNESSRTFTLVGTDTNGSAITEVMTGPNATTGQTALDFKTVTSITISGNAANALTVGTSGVASSRWVCLDQYAPGGTAIQCTASGTVNFTVQQTLQDADSSTNVVSPYLMTWVNHIDPNLVGATGTVQGNYTYAPVWAKVTLNSGTGSVSAVFAQGSNTPY